MSSSSPWGFVQYVEKIAPGCRFVGTSSHGGMMLTEKFAKKHLTLAALRRGMRHGNYYCYEEDCAWAIPAYELSQYWDRIFAYFKPAEGPELYLFKSLSAWNADYLLERGIEPDPVLFQRYKEFNRRLQENVFLLTES